MTAYEVSTDLGVDHRKQAAFGSALEDLACFRCFEAKFSFMMGMTREGVRCCRVDP